MSESVGDRLSISSEELEKVSQVVKQFLKEKPQFGVTLGFPEERREAEVTHDGDEAKYLLHELSEFLEDLPYSDSSKASKKTTGGVRVRFYDGPNPATCNRAVGPVDRAWFSENALHVERNYSHYVIARYDPEQGSLGAWMMVDGDSTPYSAVEITSIHQSPWDAGGHRTGAIPVEKS